MMMMPKQFTIDQQTLQLYVNEVDLTSQIVPQSALTGWQTPKLITFTEPSQTAVIAIKGYQSGAPSVTHVSLAIKCDCTRAGSPWNSISSVFGTGWRNVRSADASTDNFPANWYTNDYSGTTLGSVASTGTPFFLNTSNCGSVNTADKLRLSSLYSDRYVAFRRNVSQSPAICGTNSPTSIRTSSPTASPTENLTKSPTLQPTSKPSASPSQSPTKSPLCGRPSFVDVIWLLDGSSSMQDGDTALPGSKWEALRSFLVNFAATAPLDPLRTRMGFLQFAGELYVGNSYFDYKLVNSVMNITDSAAVSVTSWINTTSGLSAPGGTTNTAGGFDYVRTTMFTPENYRTGSHRMVILATDGYPTDRYGMQTTQSVLGAEAAVQQLKDEDDVYFVFLRIGNDYPPDFFVAQADYIYNTTFPTLDNLLYEDFLCVQLTDRPSKAPTSRPSSSPSWSSPTSSPTTSEPTSAPSYSPTSAPSATPSFAPSLSPTVSMPTESPSVAPTTPRPSVAPSSSVPTLAPSLSPTLSMATVSPSKVPISSLPSQTPSSSSPSVLPSLGEPSAAPSGSPTISPSQSPTGGEYIIYYLKEEDQHTWNALLEAFPEASRCKSGGTACDACGLHDPLRKITCIPTQDVASHYSNSRNLQTLDGVTSSPRHLVDLFSNQVDSVSNVPPNNNSAARLTFVEMRLTEIRMQSSSLMGRLPLSLLRDNFTELRILDFRNDAGANISERNNITYDGDCLPWIDCSKGILTCYLPPSLPPLCIQGGGGGGTTVGGINVLFFAIPIVIIILLMCCCYCFYVCCVVVAKRPRRDTSDDEQDFGDPDKGGVVAGGIDPDAEAGARRSSSRRSVRSSSNPARLSARITTSGSVSKPHRSRDGDWQEAFDYQTCKTYWINVTTGEFEWDADTRTTPALSIVQVKEAHQGNDDKALVQINVHDEADASSAILLSIKDGDKMTDSPDARAMHERSVDTPSEVFTSKARPQDESAAVSNEETSNTESLIEPLQIEIEQNEDDDVAEEEQNADQLWRVTNDSNTGKPMWEDVDTGEILHDEPTAGTVVTAAELDAAYVQARDDKEESKRIVGRLPNRSTADPKATRLARHVGRLPEEMLRVGFDDPKLQVHRRASFKEVCRLKVKQQEEVSQATHSSTSRLGKPTASTSDTVRPTMIPMTSTTNLENASMPPSNTPDEAVQPLHQEKKGVGKLVPHKYNPRDNPERDGVGKLKPGEPDPNDDSERRSVGKLKPDEPDPHDDPERRAVGKLTFEKGDPGNGPQLHSIGFLQAGDSHPEDDVERRSVGKLNIKETEPHESRARRDVGRLNPSEPEHAGDRERRQVGKLEIHEKDPVGDLNIFGVGCCKPAAEEADEDAEPYDPLWRMTMDLNTWKPVWEDVDTGQIVHDGPTIGTVVTAAELDAAYAQAREDNADSKRIVGRLPYPSTSDDDDPKAARLARHVGRLPEEMLRVGFDDPKRQMHRRASFKEIGRLKIKQPTASAPVSSSLRKNRRGPSTGKPYSARTRTITFADEVHDKPLVDFEAGDTASGLEGKDNPEATEAKDTSGVGRLKIVEKATNDDFKHQGIGKVRFGDGEEEEPPTSRTFQSSNGDSSRSHDPDSLQGVLPDGLGQSEDVRHIGIQSGSKDWDDECEIVKEKAERAVGKVKIPEREKAKEREQRGVGKLNLAQWEATYGKDASRGTSGNRSGGHGKTTPGS